MEHAHSYINEACWEAMVRAKYNISKDCHEVGYHMFLHQTDNYKKLLCKAKCKPLS